MQDRSLKQNQQHFSKELLLPQKQELNTRQTSHAAVLWRGKGKTNLLYKERNTKIEQNKQQPKKAKPSNNTTTW